MKPIDTFRHSQKKPEEPAKYAPPLVMVLQAVLGTKEAQNLTEQEYLMIQVSLENGELIARAAVEQKIQ
jgi:hypothetical protein